MACVCRCVRARPRDIQLQHRCVPPAGELPTRLCGSGAHARVAFCHTIAAALAVAVGGAPCRRMAPGFNTPTPFVRATSGVDASDDKRENDACRRRRRHRQAAARPLARSPAGRRCRRRPLTVARPSAAVDIVLSWSRRQRRLSLRGFARSVSFSYFFFLPFCFRPFTNRGERIVWPPINELVSLCHCRRLRSSRSSCIGGGDSDMSASCRTTAMQRPKEGVALHRQVTRQLSARRLSDALRWLIVLLTFCVIAHLANRRGDSDDFDVKDDGRARDPIFTVDQTFGDGDGAASTSHHRSYELARECSAQTLRCYGVRDEAIE